MALIVKDRVKETSTTSGTGTLTLAGAVAGFQSFTTIGDGNTTYYAITDGASWEVGIGTFTLSGTTLSRDVILASSNAGAAINCSGSSKDIFVVYPAGKSVYQNANGIIDTPLVAGGKIVVSDLGTLTTGTEVVDLSSAQVFTATITAGNTITFSFSNAPSASQSQVVILRLTNAGGGTIVWPASTKFVGGVAPTFTTTGVDVVGVYYDETTSTYMIFEAGLDMQ